jgi:hypothetical protein
MRMTSTMRVRMLVLGLAGAIVVGDASSVALARCTLRKSCTRALFRCFVPKGTCQTDTATAGQTSVCWANGVGLTQQAGTGGRITVLGRRGKPCVVGVQGKGPNGEFQVSWTRKKKTWVVTVNPDGSKSITCPSGKVQTFSRQDFDDGQLCGHIPSIAGPAAASCTPGTCS